MLGDTFFSQSGE